MVLVAVCYKKSCSWGILPYYDHIIYICITLVPCSSFVVYTLTACSNTISWHLPLPFLQCCAVHGFWSGTYKLHTYSFAMHGSLSLSCIEHIYMCRKYSGVQSTQTVITQHYYSPGAVWKSRWPSWASVPNKPPVFVDIKQHSTKPIVSGSWCPSI